MNKRPLIRIKLTQTDKIIEIFGWCLLLISWIWVAVHYAQLPEVIPTHFNAIGEPDGFSDKKHIWTLILMSTGFFTGMTLLNRFPHIFSYLVPITKENALCQYTYATQMIRYLKLIFVILFVILAFSSIQCANEKAEKLAIGGFIPTLLAVFIPIINFIIKSNRDR